MHALFGAGTARGGTGLVVQTLRANSRIELAMEPFLSIFKRYRLAVHRGLAQTHGFSVPALSEPMRSLYFNADDLHYADTILGTPSDHEISSSELEEIRTEVSQRAEYDAADLVPHANGLQGANYSEIIASAIDMVQRVRNRENLSYSGTLENWCPEFFPFLADHFPDSKFFLVVRDPRAVICSAFYAPVELRPSLLSFARSIRKNLDLFAHYSGDPRFTGRLCLVKFEALVNDPEGMTRQMCEFLGTDYEPQMIDPEYHVVPGSTALRDGVSSFDAQSIGYSPERASRWKNLLDPELVDVVNALMWPELVALGYLDADSPQPGFDGSLLAKVLSNPQVSGFEPHWSIEANTPAAEYGAEMLRTSLYKSGIAGNGADTASLLRECFITERAANILLDPDTAPKEWRSFEQLITV